MVKNGIYLCKRPRVYIDYHGGNEYKTVTYNWICFFENKYFLFDSTSEANSSIYLSSEEKIKLLKKDKSVFKTGAVKAGEFTYNEGYISARFLCFDEYIELFFEEVGDFQLLDNDSFIYEYIYIVGIIFNEYWLKQAIYKGSNLWVVSNPLELNLLFKDLSLVPVNSINTPLALANYLTILNDPAVLNQITSFGKEVQTLSKNGYIFNSDTKMFVKQ